MQPVTTDDRNEPIACTDGLLNHLDKVNTGLDSVDIHEDLALAEVAFQAIIEASGLRCTIVPPIANEDFLHSCWGLTPQASSISRLDVTLSINGFIPSSVEIASDSSSMEMALARSPVASLSVRVSA